MKPEHWEKIEADVRARLPEEACGLVAGEGHVSKDVIPVENIFHSPYRYRMDPQEQLSAFQMIEAHNWDLLAIYHSHPTGPDNPSETDISEAYYPEAVYIIITIEGSHLVPHGYSIIDGQVREIPVLIE